MIMLIKPCAEYEEDISLFRQEKLQYDGNAMDGCGGLEKFSSYGEWQAHLNSYADRNRIDPASGFAKAASVC